MMKSQFHFNVALLDVGKENYFALAFSTQHSLNASDAFLNVLIVSLDLEHAPVLLEADRSISFLLMVLIGFTI